MKPHLCNQIVFYTFISLLIISSCATVVKPSGGPTDRIPPKVHSATPKDSSLNFSSKHIILEFDEFVKLNNPNTQVIINPIQKEKPTFSIKGKKVKITLKDTLKPNTTYHIFFGDAIKDITEGNSTLNKEYVFSTGKLLDSCTISGSIANAQNHSVSEKIWILLLKNLKDFKDTLPIYITHPDKSGAFRFRNIAPNSYYICAIEDNNSNYKFDLPNEQIAFCEKPISISPSQTKKDSIELFSFTELPKNQKKLKTEILSFHSLQLTFRLPMQKPEIIFLEVDENPTYFWNTKKDTLKIFVTNKKANSLKLVVKDNEFADTTFQQLNTKSSSSRRNLAMDTMVRIKTNILNNSLPFSENFTFFSVTPLENIDTDKIILMAGKDTILPTFEMVDSFGMVWQLKNKLPFDEKCLLKLKKGAATSIFKFASDSVSFAFKTIKKEELGSLVIKLNKPAEKPLILTAKSDYKTYKTTIKIGEIETKFENMFPSQYTLIIIKDENEDGEWTTGDFEKQLQPEKTFIYANPIVIKKNWESNIYWNLE